MKIILIIMMFGNGKAVSSVEFNTLPACMAAATEIMKENGSFTPVRTFCVEKGMY